MKTFKINYEEAKAILNVFYQSPYKDVIPYVTILHKLKCIETDEELADLIVAEVKEHTEKAKAKEAAIKEGE